MNLFCDVLDNQLVDRNQRKMGKVDGLVVELRDDAPPRLVCIEVGPSVLAQRLAPWLGRWVAAAGRRWGAMHGEPFRIPWAKVRDVGIDVEVDLDAETTPVLAGEHWLRERIIKRIPGAE